MDDIRDRFSTKRGDYGAPVGRAPAPPKKPNITPRPPVARPAKQQSAPQSVPVRSQNNGPFGGASHTQQQYPPKAAGPAPAASFMNPSAGQAKKAKSRIRTPVKIFIIILLLAAIGAGAFYMYKTRQEQTAAENSSSSSAGTLSVAVPAEEPEPLPTGTIKMLITGDFLAYDSVNDNAKAGAKYDYLPMMKPMQNVFSGFDVRLCNQSSLGGGAANGLSISGYPLFNAPTEWSTGMESLGCNVFALASKNAADKGETAITSARTYFDNRKDLLGLSGINRTEKEKAEISYFTVKGLKIGFISYTTDTQKAPEKPYLINNYSEAVAKQQVAEAKKNAGFVIVAINWGKEDDAAVQPQQRSIAKVLATAGADLIVGSGPHITQEAEIIDISESQQSLVWYSLGGAVNSKLLTDNLVGGVGIVDIDVTTGNMTAPAFMPTYMHYEWTQAEKSSGNFNARKNLQWLPLDQSKELLAKSLLGTTIEAQTARLKAIITKNIPIEILTSAEVKARQ